MALAILFALLVGAAPPSVLGRWQTIDDKSHEPRGVVQLYEQGGTIFGKIEQTLNPKEKGALCIKCSGERKDKPVVGMVFLRNMKPQGTEFTGGDILDPETGSVYKCRMVLEDGGKKLVVRGFIGFSLLGRSQTWLRLE